MPCKDTLFDCPSFSGYCKGGTFGSGQKVSDACPVYEIIFLILLLHTHNKQFIHFL